MAGLGFAGAYGAKGASDALENVLKQKFLEQIQMAKLAEEQRQANLQHTVQQRQLGQGDVRLGHEGQRLGLDERGCLGDRLRRRSHYAASSAGASSSSESAEAFAFGAAFWSSVGAEDSATLIAVT